MCTSTFEKGGGLIAITGIMQTIAVIDNNEISNSKVVDNDSNCLHDSSDSNESSSFLNGTNTHGDLKVFFNGLNGHKFYYNSSQDKIGFIPHNTDGIPVPPQFQIPSSCQLSMSPHELELMLFINENILSPSIFDMYIIVTLKNGAVIVDCCRMMMSKTMMTSTGE